MNDCKRCGRACASGAQIFCGAGCSQRWEAGERHHVYVVNESDMFVATDEEDARRLFLTYLREQVGEDPATYEGAPVRAVADDTHIKIDDENEGAAFKFTAREWAESTGRGYLASTEW